jgi:polar amino acid transport system substrate-binding protein
VIAISKIAAVGFAAVIVASIAGCGSSTPAASKPKSLIAEIKERKELRVGVASAQPWAWEDPATKQWQGVYVDIMRDWAENTLEVKFTTVSTTWENIVAGLNAGQYDVAVALNHRPKRALAVTFSDSVMTQISAFTFNPDKTPVTTWAELNDPKYTICVMQGSSQELSLTTYGPKAQILRLADQDACRLALSAGKANAAMDDWAGTGPDAAANPGIKVLFPDVAMAVGGIAYAINAGYSYDDIQALNIQLEDFAYRGLLTASVGKWGAVDPVKYAVEPIPAYVLDLEKKQYPAQ